MSEWEKNNIFSSFAFAEGDEKGLQYLAKQGHFGFCNEALQLVFLPTLVCGGAPGYMNEKQHEHICWDLSQHGEAQGQVRERRDEIRTAVACFPT